MAATSLGVVIRQQAWFRPHVDVEGLPPFPIEQANAVAVNPPGAYRARVLIGRGPVDHELGPEFRLWFQHGEMEYPIFQIPSIGPSNAALMANNVPMRIVAKEDEALSVVEITLVQPVPPTFKDQYQQTQQTGPEIPEGSPAATVLQWMTTAKAWLEQAVGLYALYQYPIIWEPLLIHPFVGFVDLRAQTVQVSTRVEPDNFIPFRLNVRARLESTGQLNDGAFTNLAALADANLHLPLLFLQRALWQRNVQLRFLETFWLLDYLTAQHVGTDPLKNTRKKFFEILEKFVDEQRPEHSKRMKALKHIILQAPARERLTAYLEHRGVAFDPETIRQMLRLRNDLAHARPVDSQKLTAVEMQGESWCEMCCAAS